MYNSLTLEEFRNLLKKFFEGDYTPNYLDPKYTESSSNYRNKI